MYIIKVYRTVHNVVPEPYDDHLAAGPQVHISYKMYIVIARCRSISADTSVRMLLAIEEDFYTFRTTVRSASCPKRKSYNIMRKTIGRGYNHSATVNETMF